MPAPARSLARPPVVRPAVNHDPTGCVLSPAQLNDDRHSVSPSPTLSPPVGRSINGIPIRIDYSPLAPWNLRTEMRRHPRQFKPPTFDFPRLVFVSPFSSLGATSSVALCDPVRYWWDWGANFSIFPTAKLLLSLNHNASLITVIGPPSTGGQRGCPS